MTRAAKSAGKVLGQGELLARLGRVRPGATVVFTNGCFDILHPGHVDLLERAAELGDILVVGLNADASVSGLKGPSRPINPFEDRAAVLAGLSCVDYVTGFNAPTPLALIKAVRPDVLVKGGDWPVAAMVGAAEVISWGGRAVSLALVADRSTSRIVERVLSLYSLQSGKVT